jgi:competence protein ComGC
MMIKNKKAISLMFVVLLIISIVFLLMGLIFQSTILKESKYQTNIAECQTFLNSVNGKALFFGNGFDSPTFTLTNSISEICVSKDVEVSKNNLNSAKELIQSCYAQGGEGTDFMGANSNGQNVCIFCGFIKAQEEIPNFNDKLVNGFKDKKFDNFFEEKETTNLNEYLYNDSNNLPESLQEGDRLAVIYFSHKQEYKSEVKDNVVLEQIDDAYETTITEVSKFFGEITGGLSYAITDSNSQTITGVYLNEWDYDEIVTDLVDKESSTLSSTNFPLNIKCNNLVVPKNKYE